MPAKINFTDEQIEQITKLSNDGFGSRKIAKIMGVDRGKIQRTLVELGVDVKHNRAQKIIISDEQLQEAIKLSNVGWGLRKISEILQINRKHIQKAFRENNIDVLSKKSRPIHLGRKIRIDSGTTKFTNNDLNQILTMFNDGINRVNIANTMNVSCGTITRIYKHLNLDTSNRTPRYVNKDTERACKKCNTLKAIALFSRERRRYSDNTLYWSYSWVCKDCEAAARKKLNIEYPEMAVDININRCIRQDLRKGGIKSKLEELFIASGTTMEKVLGYTMIDLVKHLENQFECWMGWHNYGRYRIEEWDDNDQSTHKWSIDHIIPRADLPYTSIDDENFKKCWALSNLRPYNAKQNQIDGGIRIRHSTK